MLNLAEGGSARGMSARTRKRLTTDQGPSTATSSEQWVDWGAMSDMLGQPFDTVNIPLSKLEQMRRDPMIAFGLAFVKLPLIRAPWYIKSTDARRAAFIDNALRQIYGRLILAYCNCLDYGFEGLVKRFEFAEPDWKYIDKDDPEEPEKPVWDGGTQALVWKPFVALNPRHISPGWARDGSFNGIHFRKDTGRSGARASFPFENQKQPDIPLDWALWVTNEKDSVFGSLWGYPRTGYAYRYWWSYWYKFGLSDRAFERWADPPVAVYYPTEVGLDADGKKVVYATEGLNLAEKLRSGANVAMPSDIIASLDGRTSQVRQWEIQQMESKANFDALNQAFEYLDIQKLRALMVPEQSLVEGRGGTSSRNVASEFGDLLQESQAMVMEEIDDTINRFVIPQLLEVNYGSGGASCTKVTTGFDPQDLETMRAIVQGTANATPGRLPVDLRELLERLGIPVLSPARIKAEIDAAARAAEAAPPPEVQPGSGGTGAAGVSPSGFYYDDRGVIDLSRSLVKPKGYVIERVEELPVDHDGAAAYFDQDSMTLYVLKDAPESAWKSIMLSLDAGEGSETDGSKQTGQQPVNIYIDNIVPDS